MNPTMDKFSLKGKICLVTGGAQGLGYAMARAFADAGGSIVLADVNWVKVRESAAAIQLDKDVRAWAVQCDVTDPASVQALVDDTVSRAGRIDVLLNNAGICIHENAEDMSFEQWRKVLSVNLDGVFLMSSAVGKVMIAQGGGNIVNISSMSALIVNTPQGQCGYNASKAGVMHLTKSMATEWAMKGVRVNAIAPGYMKTDMTASVFEENGDMVKTWMAMSPTKRPGMPDELGPLAVFLASDASSFVNGAIISVDGGYTAW